jgi:hypothetical protein
MVALVRARATAGARSEELHIDGIDLGKAREEMKSL